MNDKTKLRAKLRSLRRAHVASLPPTMNALLFLRPPTTIADLVPPGTAIGLYHATHGEAPAHGYAKWFHENGFALALPWFADRAAPMRFRRWRDPYDEADLAPGPFGARQPDEAAEEVVPALVFVPVLGFTADGHRLGQGGGHYDRWLAAHPEVLAVGLAWDCQLVEQLPVEPHDHPLDAVVTPTRLYRGGK